MNSAVVGLGSNIHPCRYIAQALDILSKHHRLIRISGFVQTTPTGFAEQPDFINGVCMVKTTYSVDAFREYLKDVEKHLGRKRTANKNGPRTIDLDIVMWNGEIIGDDYYNRDFVRNAVAELLSASPEA